MACLSCNKSKKLKFSADRFAPIKQSSLFNNNDFVLGYWQGEDNTEFIGSNTQINYGVKFYAQRLLVHKNDLPDDRIEQISQST